LRYLNGFGVPLVAVLPSPHRQALHSLTGPRLHGWGAIALSILIGAWTHILLDAMTRESQIVVMYLGPLQDEIETLQRNGLRFSRLLWVALSLAGLAWLALAYLQQVRRQTGSWRVFDARETGRYLVWICVLVVPLILVTLITTAHADTWSWRRLLSVFDRVGSAGLRPLTLPHHRTCGFPHPAVERSNRSHGGCKIRGNQKTVALENSVVEGMLQAGTCRYAPGSFGAMGRVKLAPGQP
jgi:hypothetical protein